MHRNSENAMVRDILDRWWVLLRGKTRARGGLQGRARFATVIGTSGAGVLVLGPFLAPRPRCGGRGSGVGDALGGSLTVS